MKAGRCCYRWMVQSKFWSVFCVQIFFHAAQFSSNISSKEKLPGSDREKLQTQPLIKPSLVLPFKHTYNLLAPLERGQLYSCRFCPASAAMSHFNTRVTQPDRDFPPRNVHFTFASVNLQLVRFLSWERSEIAISAYRMKEIGTTVCKLQCGDRNATKQRPNTDV